MGLRARRRPGARTGAVPAALLLAATLLPAGCGTATGEEITLYHPPARHIQALAEACNERANGRYRIVVRTLPRDAEGQREQLVRRLAAQDTGLDILGLDVTWVPEFAEAGWLAEWVGRHRAEAERGVLALPLSSARWQGKLYAAPASTNVQLLFYDRTLTPRPPRTFDEMIAMSRELKAAGKPYQILLTGAQYEGLVVQYTSLVAAAGGRILSDGGERVVLDAGAVRGLAILQRLATSRVTSPGLARAQEGDVYRAFAAAESDAAFQLNWPLALAATRDLNPERAANLAATTYPGVRPGRQGKSTIGGVNLGVSAYSGKPRRAFEAAKCLRSAQSQKLAALCGGAPPAIEAIYRDPAPLDSCQGGDRSGPLSMATAFPMAEVILRAIRDAAVRPATPAYQNLSTVMAKVLSPPGDIDPPATARRLREELTKAIASRGILP
ncbi:MAG: extracellular solute-binding protein [Actinophytocola sp.]|nr:extracellular solute-binding protein [Actinophytocola sp.]